MVVEIVVCSVVVTFDSLLDRLLLSSSQRVSMVVMDDNEDDPKDLACPVDGTTVLPAEILDVEER